MLQIVQLISKTVRNLTFVFIDTTFHADTCILISLFQGVGNESKKPTMSTEALNLKKIVLFSSIFLTRLYWSKEKICRLV